MRTRISPTNRKVKHDLKRTENKKFYKLSWKQNGRNASLPTYNTVKLYWLKFYIWDSITSLHKNFTFLSVLMIKKLRAQNLQKLFATTTKIRFLLVFTSFCPLVVNKSFFCTHQHCSLVNGSNTMGALLISSKVYFVWNWDKLK